MIGSVACFSQFPVIAGYFISINKIQGSISTKASYPNIFLSRQKNKRIFVQEGGVRQKG
jgi:hypothetical protein